MQLGFRRAHRDWLARYSALLVACEGGPRPGRYQGVVQRNASLGCDRRLHVVLHRGRNTHAGLDRVRHHACEDRGTLAAVVVVAIDKGHTLAAVAEAVVI